MSLLVRPPEAAPHRSTQGEARPAHLQHRPGVAALVLGLALAGCAAAPPQAADARPPRLALAPAALGCVVAVQQRLTVQPPGQPAQPLDALLEVDAQAVRLAVFVAGQRMGSLVWDGRQLDRQLSAWWPAQLAPEQVLSDLQLAFWPAAAVQQTLAAPWRMELSASGRRLLRDGAGQLAAAQVLFLDSAAVEIRYAAGPWSLRIESPGGFRLCATGQELP